MNFQPELAQAVMAGRKTVTRRLVSDNPRSPWYRGRCRLRIGRDYAVCPGRGKDQIGRVLIIGVTFEELGYLSEAEAGKEGFGTRLDFERAWRQINGNGYNPRALVWRVAFRVAEIATCKACGHLGDDCICWYIAEQREEAAA